MRRRGSSRKVADWWQVLNPSVKEIVNQTVFKDFMTIQTHQNIDRQVVVALAERWWDSTNTFHLPLGEVTLTPLDYYILTEFPFTTKRFPNNKNFWVQEKDKIKELIGLKTPYCPSTPFTWILEIFKNTLPFTLDIGKNFLKLARVFIWYMIKNCIFIEAKSKVHEKHLAYMEDLSGLKRFNWGGAVLSLIYIGMCDPSRNILESILGYSLVWHVKPATVSSFFIYI